ncbi:MAG: hypothetical protein ABJF10_07230 [Chthoniobacter sp.]|uniref:hypothetical protein n=1 Tax=Chthoniobacter sp. TaxID=2510640 RepID=UPI0032A854CA
MKRLLFPLLLPVVLFAQQPAAFDTPLSPSQLDATAFTEWVDGAARPVEQKEGPRWVIGLPKDHLGHSGVKYGVSTNPGPRYLRVGWKSALPCGAVLVRGGGVLSVLREGAEYPGRLEDDAQWIPATHIAMGAIGRVEVGAEEFAIWTLPPGTKTRALRFAHTPKATDKEYAGWLGGAWVLPERLANIAPQAVAAASANPKAAERLNNESNDGNWQAWRNLPARGDDEMAKAAPTISTEHPQWVTLIWPRPVTLRGLACLGVGAADVDAEIFTGPADRHPREAIEKDWKQVASATGWPAGYPQTLAPNFLDFGSIITTRAVRLRLTRAVAESHPHLNGHTRDGRAVWLGEVMALMPLGADDAKIALLPVEKRDEHPPIPIHFTLREPGFVTLVIDDAKGNRVRNLLSEEPFPAGENTAWWDGSDDLGRDRDAARHGLYHIPTQFVAPGRYTVRGLAHRAIDLRYEMSVYSAGQPAWETADKTGCWMTNHTPATSALFVPGDRTPEGQPRIYLGAVVSEGGHGLQWLNTEGKKLGGQGWVGNGIWTSAATLACDTGANADKGVICYVGAIRDGELRITAKTMKDEDKPVLKVQLGDDWRRDKGKVVGTKPEPLAGFDGGDKTYVLAGIAVRDGLLVVSLPRQNELLLVDVRSGKTVGQAKVESPRGLAFDATGKLLILSGTKLIRYAIHGQALDAGQSLIANGLEDPRHIALDAKGSLYISDRGASHQVKIFGPDGRAHGAIGKPGAPRAGAYDELHLNNPNGLCVDERGRVWVAEADYQPKRVSVWSPDGKLVRAFYGPSEYGGGGQLDSQDANRFFYRGMEFALGREHGTDRLVTVFSRPQDDDADGSSESHTNGLPEYPLYFGGRRYFTNCFNSNPTTGTPFAMLWIEEKGVARRVAAFGRAADWPVLRRTEFKSRWPAGVDPSGDPAKNATFCAWSDLNGDGRPQPEEVQMIRATSGGIVVQPGLAFAAARVDDSAMHYTPVNFTKAGVPVYDLAKGEILFHGAQKPMSSGGDQVLADASGWTISTVAPAPFPADSVAGVFKGQPRWSYPSLWPGLHASHEAAVPDRRGMLVGTTRLLGGFVNPAGSDTGPLWCVNGNMGNMYLFTADGLFVAELFKDVRLGSLWQMPRAERGMDVTDLTLHDENFWPSIAQTPDGKVYLVDGGRTSLVRVDGLDSLRRLPDIPLDLSAAELTKAAAWDAEREAARQRERGTEILRVTMSKAAPVVDGKLDDWAGVQWAVVDQRGTKANFNSNSQPYDVSAALAVSGGRLYAAFRSNENDLLRNAGDALNAPFKTGGALDLMLGPGGERKGDAPVAGDIRLIVTRVGGKPRALLYRAVVPGTKEPVKFSSPWRTITLDRVDDVTNDVQLADDGAGHYEFSIPLQTLGAPFDKIQAGTRLRGDVGILRGNGSQTLQRVYWTNKATAIVADVPSEAQLAPKLWGWLDFAAP